VDESGYGFLDETIIGWIGCCDIGLCDINSETG
jgi:hypothetical protein